MDKEKVGLANCTAACLNADCHINTYVNIWSTVSDLHHPRDFSGECQEFVQDEEADLYANDDGPRELDFND